MATRRMFSKEIVRSDAFLDMPVSSQLLYFQLGMEADDDGFVDNAKTITRMTSTSGDDIKILFTKRFLLSFDNGLLVIKHWKINNYIPGDRYKETKYLEAKNGLITKDNRSYTECIQLVHKVDTQNRIDEPRLEETRLDKNSSKAIALRVDSNQIVEVIKTFEGVNKACADFYGNTTQRKYTAKLIETYGLETVQRVVAFLSKMNEKLYNKAVTPKELWDKWAKIEAEAKGLKNKGTKYGGHKIY